MFVMTFEILHLMSLELKFLLIVSNLYSQSLAFLRIIWAFSLNFFESHLLFNFIVPHFLNHLIFNLQFLF
jgi:hypothetical protein